MCVPSFQGSIASLSFKAPSVVGVSREDTEGEGSPGRTPGSVSTSLYSFKGAFA